MRSVFTEAVINQERGNWVRRHEYEGEAAQQACALLGERDLAIRDPAPSLKKPKTVCLYDGKEHRAKDKDHYNADAVALHQAALTYASAGNWAIDISNPNWRQQLEGIRKMEASNGSSIDRIMIFDHGGPGYQEFGNKGLHPSSPDWLAITASVRPRGDIVLMGCEVAKTNWTGDGPQYLDSLYANSSVNRPTIHAFDGPVRHRVKLFHSMTSGKQHSVPVD